MITHEDQIELFGLIGRNIRKNFECYAFGGTAMMFYGHKDETKDIDLLFEDENSREEFIRAIENLGFKETTPVSVYIPEKLRGKNIPLMFSREDDRFDIFTKKIFNTAISPKMKEDVYAIHDFKGKYNLKIKVLRKEFIVLLKAVTEREKDFEDILSIVEKEKNFDWNYLLDEVLWQHKHGDKWVLLDTEKTMKERKKYVFIKKEHLEKLYKSK